jgi:hypothetical protein
MTEYHCEYCSCPKEIWKKCLMTYNGDECKLYDSFLDLIDYEMNSEELTAVAREELPKEFPDIVDLDATVAELVGIALECELIREVGITWAPKLKKS